MHETIISIRVTSESPISLDINGVDASGEDAVVEAEEEQTAAAEPAPEEHPETSEGFSMDEYSLSSFIALAALKEFLAFDKDTEPHPETGGKVVESALRADCYAAYESAGAQGAVDAWSSATGHNSSSFRSKALESIENLGRVPWAIPETSLSNGMIIKASYKTNGGAKQLGQVAWSLDMVRRMDRFVSEIVDPGVFLYREASSNNIDWIYHQLADGESPGPGMSLVRGSL